MVVRAAGAVVVAAAAAADSVVPATALPLRFLVRTSDVVDRGGRRTVGEVEMAGRYEHRGHCGCVVSVVVPRRIQADWYWIPPVPLPEHGSAYLLDGVQGSIH